MAVRWRTVEILTSKTDAAADLVLLSGPPLVSSGASASCQRVLQMVNRIGITAETGLSLDVLPVDDESPRILVLGIGAEVSAADDHWLSIGGFLIEAMVRHRLTSVRLPDSATLGGPQILQMLLLGALLRSFRRTKEGRTEGEGCHVGVLLVEDGDTSCAEHAIRCADAVNRARAWVEQPPNLLTPRAWIEEAVQVFAPLNAAVRILGPQELEKIGAGALLAVGRGSEHGSQLLVVEWRGDPARDGWDAVIVGKGLTFDGGGLNLKTRPNISKMKLDMAAGASALGALQLAISRESRANAVAIVPIAENAIDALSFRPGDVLTSLAGLTVEVADTDFEGRLVLADALTYGVRNYRPTCIVDAATLTTAVTSVLHEEFAAIYASDDQLALQLIEAGEAVGERLWRMPLDHSQDYLVESEVADVCNTGAPGYFGFGIGSPTAGAKFLEKFTRGTRWAHIDITGTAWSTGRTPRLGKGATGYGVRLLDRWLATLVNDT